MELEIKNSSTIGCKSILPSTSNYDLTGKSESEVKYNLDSLKSEPEMENILKNQRKAFLQLEIERPMRTSENQHSVLYPQYIIRFNNVDKYKNNKIATKGLAELVSFRNHVLKLYVNKVINSKTLWKYFDTTSLYANTIAYFQLRPYFLEGKLEIPKDYIKTIHESSITLIEYFEFLNSTPKQKNKNSYYSKKTDSFNSFSLMLLFDVKKKKKKKIITSDIWNQINYPEYLIGLKFAKSQLMKTGIFINSSESIAKKVNQNLSLQLYVDNTKRIKLTTISGENFYLDILEDTVTNEFSKKNEYYKALKEFAFGTEALGELDELFRKIVLEQFLINHISYWNPSRQLVYDPEISIAWMEKQTKFYYENKRCKVPYERLYLDFYSKLYEQSLISKNLKEKKRSENAFKKFYKTPKGKLTHKNEINVKKHFMFDEN